MPRQLVALALIGTTAAAPLAAVAAGWDWYLDGPVIILLAVAAGYAAGAWLPRLVALAAALAATTALVTANQLHDVRYHWLDDSVFYLVIVGGAAAAGAAVTTRAQQVRRLERLQAELDEQQRVDVAAARLDEQNRIHHEVHTRLAERIAGIAVRAEGARRSGDDAALRVIETEARGVLDQLRGALGSMRSESPEAAQEQPAERRPRPSATVRDRYRTRGGHRGGPGCGISGRRTRSRAAVGQCDGGIRDHGAPDPPAWLADRIRCSQSGLRLCDELLAHSGPGDRDRCRPAGGDLLLDRSLVRSLVVARRLDHRCGWQCRGGGDVRPSGSFLAI